MDSFLGIDSRDWWALLRETRFAIDPPFWRWAVELTFRSRATTRDRQREDAQFGAALERAQIKPPVFILGHWRTGTTLLHELMALDEQFAYPNLFQVSHPHTFLLREEAVARMLADLPPEQRPMDSMLVQMSSPGEDESALSVASLRSPLVGWSFPRLAERYDRYMSFRGVPQADVERWTGALIRFMKKLTLKYERPLLLKSPTHTGKLRLLRQLFPAAKFVHIYRDPYTVFQSTQRLYETAVPHSYLQRPDPASVEAGILRRYALMYEAYFEDRQGVPADQLHELRFEDLERDIVGQVEQIYGALKLPDFEQLRPKLERYVAERKGYTKNRYQPLEEPLRRKVAQAWRRNFETWGYAP